MEGGHVDEYWKWIIWAVPVGLSSGLLGIGGGIVLIPILVLALRFKIHVAIGTPLAIVVLSSLGGVTGYIINGIGVAGRLPYSFGYVNLLSWILVAVPSTLIAPIGAAVSPKIPQRVLTHIFVIILSYFGLKMIGVFNWIGP